LAVAAARQHHHYPGRVIRRDVFVVIDSTGQKLAYFEEQPGRRSAARLLTKGEARRIATNV
jgi:hypothetical protein